MQTNADMHGIQPTVVRKFKMAKENYLHAASRETVGGVGGLKVVISRYFEKRENRKGYPMVTSHSTAPQTPATAGS